MKADSRKRWEPSEDAFKRLLEWLDQGSDSKRERYLDIRDRLVHYFERRNSAVPDDLADETLNRVARRLEEEGAIDDIVPARYCYIVARFVWLESLRQREREVDLSVREFEGASAIRTLRAHDTAEERERTVACLQRCLAGCSASERQLILDYYGAGSGSASVQRKRLAARLGVTASFRPPGPMDRPSRWPSTPFEWC